MPMPAFGAAALRINITIVATNINKWAFSFCNFTTLVVILFSNLFMIFTFLYLDLCQLSSKFGQ